MRRRVLWVAMAAIVAGLGVAVPTGMAAAGAGTDPVARLLALVNQERAERGLGPLTVDGTAEDHAYDVAVAQRDGGRLSHTSAEDLADWYMPPYQKAAETLGYASDGTPDSVFQAWMAASRHRDLLLAPWPNETGVGAVSGADGALWATVHLLGGDAAASPSPTPAPAPEPAATTAPAVTPAQAPLELSSPPPPPSDDSTARVTATSVPLPPAAISSTAGEPPPKLFTEMARLWEVDADLGGSALARNPLDTGSSCDGAGCGDVQPAGRKRKEGGVMYHFAVIALLALATVKLVDFLADNVRQIERMRSLLMFVAAIGGVWILDYSLFAGWGIDVRNSDVGVWVTGFVVAGLTVPWRAVFGYLSHHRATADETLGEHMPIRKAA